MRHHPTAPWRPALVAAGLLGCGLAAWADPPYAGTPTPKLPIPGPSWQSPTEVPGKEYSSMPNKDFAHNLAPGQTMMWDGLGGVKNGALFPTQGHHVDALANHGDALFWPLWNNQAHLLYSMRCDGASAEPKRERVWIEPWNQPVGMNQVWATTADINHDIEDLNGLEVWGPDNAPDSNRYSIVGDVLGISIYNANGTAYLSQNALAGVIAPFLTDPAAAQSVDLDALMVYDSGLVGEWDPGDALIFSVAPLCCLDGGEIFTWQFGGPAGFLKHDGHTWDTAFDVRGHTPNSRCENVDAIEAIAVPEPAAWAWAAGLFCAGAAYLVRRRKA